jgi:hypothetical protein
VPWGRIALTFDDCGSGGMRWDGPPDWGSMEVPIKRLSSLAGLNCASGTTTAAQPSGGWYDPVVSGDGFLVDQLDANTLSVLYFVLSEDGTQTWFQGLDTLLTTGNYGYGGELFQPHGTHFGAAFDSSQIDKSIGIGSTIKLACTTGSALTGPAIVNGQSGFGPLGSFSLQRLTTPLGIAACSP